MALLSLVEQRIRDGRWRESGNRALWVNGACAEYSDGPMTVIVAASNRGVWGKWQKEGGRILGGTGVLGPGAGAMVNANATGGPKEVPRE